MTRIRQILGIFSSNAKREHIDAPLQGDDLVAFLRQCQDPKDIDRALCMAGGAPFWPQDARLRLFYSSAAQDRQLMARLRAAAAIGHQARRHALAHLHRAPDPAVEAQLPKRMLSHLHLIAPAPYAGDSVSYMRVLQLPRSGGMKQQRPAPVVTSFGGDITAAVAEGHDETTALRRLAATQICDMLRLWLQTACGGAIPAALDGALRDIAAAISTAHAEEDAFAPLRIALAASPRLPAADRAAAIDMTDATAAMITNILHAPVEDLFTCRDDQDVLTQGFGDRRQISIRAIFADGDSAAIWHRFAEAMDKRLPDASAPAVTGVTQDMPLPTGLCVTRAEYAARDLAARPYAHDALAEMTAFARLAGTSQGNRALRQYWQTCEDAGLPSRIGSQMGLMLGDLQTVYEELTRRDIHNHAPDIRHLQDRQLSRGLAQPAYGVSSNDSA